jgi:hypothetical protein
MVGVVVLLYSLISVLKYLNNRQYLGRLLEVILIMVVLLKSEYYIAIFPLVRISNGQSLAF